MSMIHVDFRLMEARYELLALDEYLKTVKEDSEKCLDELSESLKHQLREAEKSGCGGDIDIARQWAQDVQENVVPRFYLNMATVSIHSTLEFCINDIVSLFESKTCPGICFRDLHRSELLQRCKKYFSNIVGITFCTDNQDWEILKQLTDVRNCVTHSNGFLGQMNKGARRRLENLIQRGIGVEETTSAKRIIVRPEFLDKSHQAVVRTITSLMDEVIEVLDAPPK